MIFSGGLSILFERNSHFLFSKKVKKKSNQHGRIVLKLLFNLFVFHFVKETQIIVQAETYYRFNFNWICLKGMKISQSINEYHSKESLDGEFSSQASARASLRWFFYDPWNRKSYFFSGSITIYSVMQPLLWKGRWHKLNLPLLVHVIFSSAHFLVFKEFVF